MGRQAGKQTLRHGIESTKSLQLGIPLCQIKVVPFDSQQVEGVGEEWDGEEQAAQLAHKAQLVIQRLPAQHSTHSRQSDTRSKTTAPEGRGESLQAAALGRLSQRTTTGQHCP